MQFGVRHLGRKTPQVLANFGHTLLAVSTAVSGISVISAFPKVAIISGLVGGLGNLLVNMFGEDDIKKPGYTAPYPPRVR